MALFNQKTTNLPPTGPVPTPVAPAVEQFHSAVTDTATAGISPAASALPPLQAQSESQLPPLQAQSASQLPPLQSSGQSGLGISPEPVTSSLLPLGSAPVQQSVAPAASLPPLGVSTVYSQPSSSVDIDITPSIGAISSQYKPAVLETSSSGGLLPGMLPLSGKSGTSPISATGGLTGTWSSTGVTDPFHPYGLDGMNGLLPMSTPADNASLPSLLPILPTRNTPVIQIFRNDDGNYTAKHVTKHKECRGINEYEAFMSLLKLI